MFLRFEAIGRIGIVSSFVLLACTSTASDNKGGTGGTGSNAGGMVATAGASTSGGASSSAGGSSSGTASGGAGAPSGGAGSGSGGTAGASAGSAGSSGSGGSSGNKSKTTFFVTSDTSKTGKLGGLDGADKRCQDLAKTAGFGDHTFHAYLSTSTVNAKDRIGKGPWVNAKGTTVAPDVATLHSAATKGDHTIFIDEKGNPIHGQWDGGTMVEHDVLTGSMADGTVQAGKTCMDWTSASNADTAEVGHSDGMGPGMAATCTAPTSCYSSWNSSHENGGCDNTTPRGGAGRIYCFAID